MITLFLCMVAVAKLLNATPHSGYQLFAPDDAPKADRIATITGTVSPNGTHRVQRAADQPMPGDVLPYLDQFIEVHETDWLFVP